MPAPLRIAIYARYSSDAQSPTSVEDQVALCRKLVAEQFGSSSITVYEDAAISGATMQRSGMQALLKDSVRRKFSIVVAEGLDRLSRSLKDIATIHETLTGYGVKIYTSHEGWISELHVGLKGTMNALYLKDLREKTRRGLSARASAGFATSRPPYGYRVKREFDEKGAPIYGLREIDPQQAAVVRRIYQDYLAGKTYRQITGELNAEGIPSPSGQIWKKDSLRSSGEGKVYHGILSNEIYRGVLIHNRSRVVRNPLTGAKRAVANPKSEWVQIDVPSMRIVENDLWLAVQECLEKTTKKPKKPKREYHYNARQLTNFVFCGVCGGAKHIAHENRYVCASNRYSKTCKNARGTPDEVIRAEVFARLYRRIRNKNHSFRQAFEKAFAEKIQIRDKHSEQEKDLLSKIDRLIQCIENGVDVEHSTQRILGLQEELKTIRAALDSHEVPDFPDDAEIRLRLWKALKNLETKTSLEFRDVVRAMLKKLVEKIVLTPIEGKAKGEKIAVTLKEDGWLDYWLSLQT